MNTQSYKTVSQKKETVDRKWYIVDAEGEVVGRLCSRIAHVLRGKNKPTYTPHVDTGDYVIVINADKIRFTGQKMFQKEYIRHTGYPGGQRVRTAREQMDKHPKRVVEAAVRGMLAKNRLGRQMLNKLFVYAGAEHPHQAQKPEEFSF